MLLEKSTHHSLIKLVLSCNRQVDRFSFISFTSVHNVCDCGFNLLIEFPLSAHYNNRIINSLFLPLLKESILQTENKRHLLFRKKPKQKIIQKDFSWNRNFFFSPALIMWNLPKRLIKCWSSWKFLTRVEKVWTTHC